MIFNTVNYDRFSTGFVNQIANNRVESFLPVRLDQSFSELDCENRMNMDFMICVCHRYVIGWI